MRLSMYSWIVLFLMLLTSCEPAPREGQSSPKVAHAPVEEASKTFDAPPSLDENPPAPVYQPPAGAVPMLEPIDDVDRPVSSPSLNRGGSGANHDQCPTDPEKTLPGVCGCGTPDADEDGDGVLGCLDNCVTEPNALQADTDSDGIGDACDNCPIDLNSGQEDEDNDGIGSACDCDDSENFIGSLQGVPRYVNPSSGHNLGKCTDFNAPCQTIAYAIYQADSGDSIVLAKGYFFENNLTVTKSLSFFGYGPSQSIISAGHINRVFTIPLVADDVLVRICGITATLGDADEGGAIYNQEQLQVINSVVSHSSAKTGGGIFSQGPLLLFNSSITGNSSINEGGGVYTDVSANQAAIFVALRSTIAQNTSGTLGGGIFSSGKNSAPSLMLLFSSTVGHNRSASGGGGIREHLSLLLSFRNTINDNVVSAGNGGGINSTFSLSFLRNTTISGNAAFLNGGGLYQVAPSVAAIQLSTITNNGATGLGGGVFSSAMTSINFTHSIVADQAAGADCAGTGTYNSGGYNLESAATCNFVGADDLNNAVAKLGPLAANGGFTLTHEPLFGSQAIDAGNTNCNAVFDQRGFSRPVDSVGVDPIDSQARCDIGSVEVQ